jgi:ribosomal protein RSM22 (predicted rRNA methylase)
MLPRYQASKVCRSCSRDLLQSVVQSSPQPVSRQLHHGVRRLNSTLLGSQRRFSAVAFFPIDSQKLDRIKTRRLSPCRRIVSTTAPSDDQLKDKRDAVYSLIDRINQTEDELAELLDELYLLDDYEHILNVEGWDLDGVFSGTIGHRDHQALEAKVRLARQQFGETLPEGHLNAVETKLYERLYGEPIIAQEDPEDNAAADKEPNLLLRDDGKGGFEEVDLEQIDSEGADIPVVYDMDAGPPEGETHVMARAREIAEQLGGELMLEPSSEEDASDSTPRLHPLTQAGKFSTDPSTIFLPQDTVTDPISAILSKFSNKHIAEAAHRSFGGQRLPHSTTTLPPRDQVPQLPIPLNASQHHMGEMEANAYIAALYPGVYASAMSVLVEVRKRLGTDWIRGLMTQEGGPRVLDAGGGGAAVLAWRDIVRAEYELMVPGYPKGAPVPTGKSTVLAASDALQRRASLMLENTTFLPRLPDYVHVRDTPTLEDERAPPKRKQYDVIIAPHTLLQIEEDYLRKQHVKNLWSLLNPDGGVLILLEKGRQRGFEAIAGAREMLLERHISSPGSTEYEGLTESGDDGFVKKEAGMIIAPCTNHEKCPMYQFSGSSKGRSDYCRFEQRFIRPPFLQRIIGAKDRNHEDVEFSYIAVQRGIDLRQTEGIVQGAKATESAFEGYEDLPEEAGESLSEPEAATTSATSSDAAQSFSPLSLPRTILPPIKRRGHVIFDLCTPEGKIERWTVPRSFSRQAYRDARKAQWGDLWALGAKTRIPRNLRIGTPKDEDSKKERLERRAASKVSQMEEDADDLPAVPEEEDTFDPTMISALAEQAESLKKKKRGQTIPSWKRHADKKRIRQAFKKASAGNLDKGSAGLHEIA